MDESGEIDRLRSRLRELERVRAMGDLAEGVLHDLNNHVGLVISLAEQVQPLVTDPDTRQAVTVILGATQRGARFLDQVRRSLRRCGDRPGPCDLEEVVQRAVVLIHKTRQIQGGGLTMDVPPAGLRVRCVDTDVFAALLHASAILRREGHTGQRIVACADGEHVRLVIAGEGDGGADQGLEALHGILADATRPWLGAAQGLSEDARALLMLWPALRVNDADLMPAQNGLALRLPAASD